MRKSILLLLLVTSLWLAPDMSGANPSLHRYQTGKQVKGLQWLLQGHQLQRHGRKVGFQVHSYRGPLNGVYDLRTARAVKNTKYKLGWPSKSLDGKRAGRRFFDVLEGKQTRPASWRLRAGNRVRVPTPKPAPVSDKAKVLLADAQYLVDHRSLVAYSQVIRMQIVKQKILLPPLKRYIYEDCSSSVTGLYWLAHLPDPNGLGYNGYGYTGTQAAHGVVVWRIGQPLSQLKPGDLIFYGGGWPHHHVTMYLGNGRVFSHGTSLGPYNLPVLYRSDAVGAHRYFGLG